MSLQGNATATELRGKINSVDVLCIDAYGVAVRNGFKGTEKEWLESLKPKKGVDYYTEADKAELLALLAQVAKTATAKISTVTLLAEGWVGTESPYHQEIAVSGATEHSKIEINPSVEQLAIFHEKDIAFVVENEDGVITVYCVGQKPTNDYTVQVTVTEVLANG